jgi:hypothetical protein
MIKLLDILKESIQDDPIELFNSLVKPNNGFHLVPYTGTYFSGPKELVFTTTGNKPTPQLAKTINDWIIKNFPNNKLRVAYSTTYKTLNFYTSK